MALIEKYGGFFKTSQASHIRIDGIGDFFEKDYGCCSPESIEPIPFSVEYDYCAIRGYFSYGCCKHCNRIWFSKKEDKDGPRKIWYRERQWEHENPHRHILFVFPMKLIRL